MFCGLAGRRDLAQDERYSTNEKRLAEYDTLRPIVAAIVAQHNGRAFVDLLSARTIPTALVAEPKDLFEDPHLNAGNHLVETKLTTGAMAKLPRLPIEIDGMELDLVRQPPDFGEHTHDILVRHGYSQQEIEELLRSGAVA